MSEKASKGLKVPFGMKAGRLVAPTEAIDAGLNCGCTCPGCGARLLLRQGNRRRHFAHYNAPGSDRCVESAIHAAAKQVLIDHGGLMVPEVAFEVSATTLTGTLLREDDVLSAERRIRFDRTAAEVTIGDIRPDVVGYKGERQLLVEMYFRHRVDVEKRGKLRKLGLPALEIDLSDLDQLDDFEAVKQRVLENVEHKEWLFYPRQQEYLTYLKHKLSLRVEAENEAHKAELERQRQKRRQLAQMAKAQQVALVGIDNAFAHWERHEQEAWLLDQLGLSESVPAFLSRPSYPATVLPIPAFLFQASIFERFVHQSPVETKLTDRSIYPCLRRRFNLQWHDAALHQLAINLYLRYLAKAGFLRDGGTDMLGPYYVVHSDLWLPQWRSFETRYDGDPLLSEQAGGSGVRREWMARWPSNWQPVMYEAGEMLAGSRHREPMLTAIESLSTKNRPPSPHHWAEPLVARGVPLGSCLDVLSALGLITG